MRSRNAQMVREFRQAFGLNAAAYPQLPDRDTLALHSRLLAEEVQEFAMAAQARDPHEVLDALADVIYVAYGAALDCGYDVDAALVLVHEANMAKLADGKPLRRADGKVVKPDGWRPPDLSALV